MARENESYTNEGKAMSQTQQALVEAALKWYRARRPSNWCDTDNIGHRDNGMRLHYTADFELMDAVERMIRTGIKSPIESANKTSAGDYEFAKEHGHYPTCGVYEGTQQGPCDCKDRIAMLAAAPSHDKPGQQMVSVPLVQLKIACEGLSEPGEEMILRQRLWALKELRSYLPPSPSTSIAEIEATGK